MSTSQPRVTPNPSAATTSSQRTQASTDWQRARHWLGFFTRKWVVVLILLGIIFFAISHSGSKSEKLNGKLAAAWQDIGYRKTVVFVKSDLKDTKICDIHPGTRKFRTQENQAVKVIFTKDGMPYNYDVTSFLLVNDTIQGERFEVGTDGCVILSFSFPQDVRASYTFTPQRFALTFE